MKNIHGFYSYLNILFPKDLRFFLIPLMLETAEELHININILHQESLKQHRQSIISFFIVLNVSPFIVGKIQGFLPTSFIYNRII